jgi:release factor H-coupled RctB family protein
MGNHNGFNIQTLSASVNLVANADTWIEGKAIQQLQKTAELEGVVKAAGMPDLHPGRGYPIGAAFLTQDKIYPALIGNDIGCGMALWATDIKVRKANLDKFEKRLASIDEPLTSDWKDFIFERYQEKTLSPNGFERALGTVGGGNHFAELQQLDQVIDEALVGELGIDQNHLVLLVHSGSRGLGERILRSHVDRFGHAGLNIGSSEFTEYLQQHDEAIKFAELNRELIAMRMLENLHAKGNQVLDVNHNLVTEKTIANQSHWIHRKGATPADCGLVMIPGSRGDYSYLVKPNADPEVNFESIFSLAHGAGRKWMRTECKDRLSKRYRQSDLEKTALGSRVVCKNKALIFEEAPEAYKSIWSVIDAMQDAGLIDLVARFKPVLTYKTNGGC